MEIRDYLEKSGKRNEIQGKFSKNLLTFSRRRRYHIETSPLICGPNQWTSFYMITASVLKGLNQGNSGKGLRNLSKQIFQHCHLLVFDISPSAFLCVHNLFLYVWGFVFVIAYIASSVTKICNMIYLLCNF